LTLIVHTVSTGLQLVNAYYSGGPDFVQWIQGMYIVQRNVGKIVQQK